MNKKSISKNIVIVTILVFQFIIINTTFADVKLHQVTKVNNNGSATITLTYSASEDEVKKNNNIFGNLPFDEKELKNYFSFPSGEVKKAITYKDKNKPGISFVNVEIFAQEISKITSSKALNGLSIGWSKTDTGMVFRWIIPKTFMSMNMIESYQYILSFEGELQSTNGLLNNNEIRYFIFANKMDPKGALITATLKPGQNFSTSNQSNNSNNTSNTGTEEKSCGLFGIELPILVLGGLSIINRSRKKRKK